MAELEIKERQAGDVTILDLSGKITIGTGDVALRTTVRQAVQAGTKKVVLGASGVTEIDGAGAVALADSVATIERGGAQARIAGLSERLQNQPEIAKRLAGLSLYAHEAEALSSFR